ncbi:PAS and ANTAR domain-containing protein [Nocardioides sp. GCM10027113]|uniref:PAS and ANTAR domain-containing protein n=1 Tax=unclassified Nocardioides TaxID=2615069 RepID=UPI00362270A2
MVPTSEMLAAHHHPDDLAKVQDVVLDALEEGGLFTSYHRMIDSQSRTHHVRVVGETITNTDGDVAWLRGYVVGVSEVRRDEIEASIAPAVEGATRHRAAIEQAKGALMLARGVDADTAFGILRRCSQRANLRVNVLAERLADLLATAESGDTDLVGLLARAAGLPDDELRALAEPASLER